MRDMLKLSAIVTDYSYAIDIRRKSRASTFWTGVFCFSRVPI